MSALIIVFAPVGFALNVTRNTGVRDSHLPLFPRLGAFIHDLKQRSLVQISASGSHWAHSATRALRLHRQGAFVLQVYPDFAVCVFGRTASASAFARGDAPNERRCRRRLNRRHFYAPSVRSFTSINENAGRPWMRLRVLVQRNQGHPCKQRAYSLSQLPAA